MRYRVLGLTVTVTTLLFSSGCQTVGFEPADRQASELVPALVSLPLESDVWNLVGSAIVRTTSTTRVEGSRYTLTFSPQTLDEDLQVTIKERSPDWIDVELGPDGTQFRKSVTFEIDYRGTPFDPSHPDYKGRPARLFWFNPETLIWVLVPGTDDPKKCLFTAELEHFSRYSMGDGTSGWEDLPADREKDAVK